MLEEEKQDADLQSGEQEDAGIEVDTQEVETPSDQKEDPSDKLTPDHPRFKDVLTRAKDAEDKLAELESQLQELRESRTTKSEDDNDLSEEERISLAKIKRELRKDGFVVGDDLRVQERTANLKSLGERFDGRNGLPKFDRTEVVAYAKLKGFGDNYEAAYKDMHYDAILEQEAIKLSKAPKAPSSEKPSSGGETSGKKRVTRQDISNMSEEEYEIYRSQILTGIKPQ